MAQRLNEILKGCESVPERVAALIEQMSLAEKIGQLCLVNGVGGKVTPSMKQAITDGGIGGIINEVNPEVVGELQRIAVEDSRLGIPLLIGRDVVHGFITIFPIPLGMASAWNPDIVEQCGRISALEASVSGINWTFAPVVDVCRDPRWGRIAETFGEDTHLSCVLARAMVQGFQGRDMAKAGGIGACAKHFAGYGASESGKDYNTTNIPENELRNVHLPPFKAAVEAGVMSLMTSFSDLDGIPASANEFLLKRILRQEWGFEGMVVSDWGSISQLSVHGLTANDKESAFEAINAGVDMEMSSRTYRENIEDLLDESRLDIAQIDAMVSNILTAKLRLGLFDRALTRPARPSVSVQIESLAAARKAAVQSCVLLENKNRSLPLAKGNLRSIAVIGPLADEPHEQLGTWVFDGDEGLSRTPLRCIESFVGDGAAVNYCRALESTRSNDHDGFDEAVEAASNSDVVIIFAGEESILSGEAHCRADIGLPGAQEDLINAIRESGKTTVLVIMSGRPLLLQRVKDKVDAILYAWHPGAMAGPAITDLLFGVESPSGKLPVTFPRVMGQIPIYYAHKNTGRPATLDTIIHIDDIEAGAVQHSVGNTSFHLDTDDTPLYPFGYGRSYTEFSYSNLRLSSNRIAMGGSLTATVDLANVGDYEAEEVVQLYIRDLVGSVTRPVRELKGFQRIRLKPGESKSVTFALSTDDLAFYDRRMKLTTEPGEFHLWVGGDSNAELKAEFEVYV